MKQKLLRLLFVSLLFSQALFFSFPPQTAEAALVPCGLSSGTVAQMAPCTLCHLIVGLHTIIDWMRNVMVAIAITVIVAMGILYIVSTGNEELMKVAKEGIKASLIGFAVILSAWLIVNTIFLLPVFNKDVVHPNWYSVSCNLQSSAQTASSANGNTPPITNGTPTGNTTKTPDPLIPIPTGPTTITLSPNPISIVQGGALPLYLSGSINESLGSLAFDLISQIEINLITKNQATVTVEGSAPLQSYPITLRQGSTIVATGTLIVVAPGATPGGDPGGPPEDVPPDEGGGSCGTAPHGARYNLSLPRAPMTNWTAEQLYSYWKSLPESPDCQSEYKDVAKFGLSQLINSTLTNHLAFGDLILSDYFHGDRAARANWIQGNSYGCSRGNVSFDINTGISTASYGLNGSPTHYDYPASGIPRPASCDGSGGPGGPPWNGRTCPGFNGTRVVDMSWSRPIPVVAPMGVDDAIVVRFTTGSVNSPPNNLPKVTGIEFGSPPSQRAATLSDKPCDFGGGLAAGASGIGNTVTFPFSVGSNNTGRYPALKQNTTYYVNVKNAPIPSCASTGVCQMQFELQKPHGI